VTDTSTQHVDMHGGAVDNLVKQFSSAMDCLRELVQNSIDAQSPRVEIWMEYERGEGHLGTIQIHVDDVGEGMDENIIDNQLTRLFASSKEHDLTKIGKFGIGFVSIFALSPKGVLIHTGRGGEYWEIFFHEDKSFTKGRLPHPVEGTQLTLFLEGDLHRYRDLVEKARETLKRWCAHSETEVTFEDRHDGEFEVETINEKLHVDGECLTRVEHQGTQMLLAYSNEPVYGFYNRGLTLAHSSVADQVLDRRAARYGHIALKVKSRYLEHTLSRETVLRDENYEKAMRLLDAAADGDLLDALIVKIEALTAMPSWGPAELNAYARYASFLVAEPVRSYERFESRPVLRRLDGRAITPEMLEVNVARDGHLLFADFQTDLIRTLGDQGVPVMLGRARGEGQPLDVVRALAARAVACRRAGMAKTSMRELFGWIVSQDVDVWGEITSAVAAPEDVYVPVQVDDETPPALRPLLDAALALLRAAETGYRRLETCRLAAPVDDAPLFVVGRKLGPLMAWPPKRITERQHKKRPEAAVNRDDPRFEHFVRLYASRPELAAYCLAKHLLLTQDRLLDKDLALMSAARPEVRARVGRRVPSAPSERARVD
jgi:hypothetical protein